jgi:phosphomannomutase
MACLIALGVFAEMKKAGKSVSKLIAEITAYASTGEVNFEIERKLEAMDAIRDHFTACEKTEAYFDFDGYRVEFRDWWFNVRPSNTEPYLRFLAEAKDAGMLKDILAQVEAIVHKFKD